MPRKGLEPLPLAGPDPKSGASTNFATLADGIFLSCRIVYSELKEKSAVSVLRFALLFCGATRCNAEQRTMRAKHAASFLPVFDGRKRKIPSL